VVKAKASQSRLFKLILLKEDFFSVVFIYPPNPAKPELKKISQNSGFAGLGDRKIGEAHFSVHKTLGFFRSRRNFVKS
jgi:hypothetical protein